MSVAIIGAVVGVAGTAYGIYSQQQAVSAANSAHPRAFVPIDIHSVAQQALAADQAGYNISDIDWNKRFPKLKQGRDYNIADAGANLRGVASPTITRTLAKSGLGADLGNTEEKQAQNLGMPVLSLEQRDRNYFQKQLGMNPQRTAGLSGQDVAHIAIANTNSQSNFNQGAFGSRINMYNAQVQQYANNAATAVGGLGVLGSLYNNYQDRQNQPGYTDAGFYSPFNGQPYNQGGLI